MLLLLPPSEGKARPARGKPVDLGALAHADALTARRAELLDRLRELCTGDREAARAALGLSVGQAGDVDLDAGLREAPTAQARQVYTGVLFERLDLATVPARRAGAHVLIASALWGVVRPGDRIPAYRLSIGARLPGLPGLAAWWKPALREALPDDGGLVVDCRSGGYAAAWRPRASTHLPVRAFTEAADGTRTVVSHMAKAARGDVARALLLAARVPRTPEAAAAACEAAGLRVELSDGALDVVSAPGRSG